MPASSWQNLGLQSIGVNWVYTPPCEGYFFRLSFIPPFRTFQLLVAQCELSGSKLQIFDIRKVYPRSELEILQFEPPPFFTSRRIGIRGVGGQKALVKIEVSNMPISNPSAPNYPVSTVATSTTVASSATSVAILAANSSRKGATIWNASTATLYLDLDAAATVADYAARLDPGGYYEVPYGFTGALSGIWSSVNGSALVREFT